ncbi:hypothetical protein ACQEVY_01390 [Streptomyces sp. CA-288835]|uniref:hypothetical protein n=1 Tax=Streptomyces sp. CA-288835 TaxID=3240069 RepID=UPI003D8EA842
MTRPLPDPAFWALIHSHTGDLADTQPTERGFGSDLSAVVECEKGPFFVKAMRNRPGGRRDSITRERLINPFIRSFGHSAESAEWWAARCFQAWVNAARRHSTRSRLPPCACIAVSPSGSPMRRGSRSWRQRLSPGSTTVA